MILRRRVSSGFQPSGPLAKLTLVQLMPESEQTIVAYRGHGVDSVNISFPSSRAMYRRSDPVGFLRLQETALQTGA